MPRRPWSVTGIERDDFAGRPRGRRRPGRGRGRCPLRKRRRDDCRRRDDNEDLLVVTSAAFHPFVEDHLAAGGVHALSQTRVALFAEVRLARMGSPPTIPEHPPRSASSARTHAISVPGPSRRSSPSPCQSVESNPVTGLQRRQRCVQAVEVLRAVDEEVDPIALRPPRGSSYPGGRSSTWGSHVLGGEEPVFERSMVSRGVRSAFRPTARPRPPPRSPRAVASDPCGHVRRRARRLARNAVGHSFRERVHRGVDLFRRGVHGVFGLSQSRFDTGPSRPRPAVELQ